MNRQAKAPEAAVIAPRPDSRLDGAELEASSRDKANGSHRPLMVDGVFDRLILFFSSLRLTVVCLGLGLVLVFWGTLAQVELGLFKAQNEFFRSFLIYWGPKGATWKIPIFPGGYLVGGLLLLNLVTAHFKRFVWTRKKIGIWMVHVGVILLLLGQLLTDVLSSESSLRLREGQAKNYSETERECELAVIDATDPDTDKVVAIPQAVLAQQKEIRHPEMPFTVRVKKFYANSLPSYLSTNSVEPGVATRDVGTRATVKDLPRVTDMDYRDVPSAVVELATPQGSLGSWLVSEHIDQPQTFSLGNRSFQLALRMRRHYEPYSLQLLKFQHDVYAGTDIPKNFASRVVLQRPETGEKREVLIYMNSPLRYAGQTYYQAGFDRDDHGTNLQVVHNPSWLTPYFSCILVGAGLLVQFLTHLIGFATKRKLA
jgi:hypothetical protein